MKRRSCFAFIVLVAGFLLAGCDRTKNPLEISPAKKTAPDSPGKVAIQNLGPTDVSLAGFTVHYDGRTFTGTQTTFQYTVSGPTQVMHFRIELPACAPPLSSWAPTTNVSFNNDAAAGINPGIEWSPSVGSGTTNTFTFRVTYPGAIREGIVRVAVNSNGTTADGEIAGACARVFDISGTIFTDANSNGLFDGGETGIGGVTVNLVSFVAGAAVSNENGLYIFEAFPAGNYALEVDETTVVLTSTKYLGATTPTNLSVSIGPNSTGNNFGFAPKSAQLINDLKGGTLLSDGRPASYWKKQLQIAISGKGTPDFSKATLQSFVTQIRALLLPEPYPLAGGDGLKAAYDLLNRPVKTDLDKLRRELLAAEFNHVAGLGIVDTDAALQLVLLGWGESLVLSNSITTASASGLSTNRIGPSATAASSSTLSDAVSLFTVLNSSGGGGGGH